MKRKAEEDSPAGSDEGREDGEIPLKKVQRVEQILAIGGWTGTVKELAESGDIAIRKVWSYVNGVDAVRKMIPYYGELAKYGPCCKILNKMFVVAGYAIERRMLVSLQGTYVETLIRSSEGRGAIMIAMGSTHNYTRMQKIVIQLLEYIKSDNVHLLRPFVKRLNEYINDTIHVERRNAMIRAVGSKVLDLVQDEELYTLVISHLAESRGKEFYYMVGKLLEISHGNCPGLLVLLVSENKVTTSNTYNVLKNVLLGMRRTWIPYHKQVVDILRPYVRGVHGLEELL